MAGVRGGDVARRAGGVAECDTKLADHARQRRVGDDGACLDGIERLGLGEQPTRPAKQASEQDECLSRHRHGLAIALQPMLSRIGLKGPESPALDALHDGFVMPCRCESERYQEQLRVMPCLLRTFGAAWRQAINGSAAWIVNSEETQVLANRRFC